MWEILETSGSKCGEMSRRKSWTHSFFFFFISNYTCTQWVKTHNLSLQLTLTKGGMPFELELIDKVGHSFEKIWTKKRRLPYMVQR
jgi:hypothetical protein